MAARMSVSFTEPQMKWLKTESNKLGITTSDLIRRILDDAREASRPYTAKEIMDLARKMRNG